MDLNPIGRGRAGGREGVHFAALRGGVSTLALMAAFAAPMFVAAPRYARAQSAIISTGGVYTGISGSSSLRTISGTTTLIGSNTYTGATNVIGGVLRGGATNVFSAASATTVNAGGTLDLGGLAQTINNVSLAGGTLKSGSLAGMVNSTGGSLMDIGGGASLRTTAGTTTLTRSNTYAGPTTINGGVLKGGATNAFSAASATTVNAGGTLDLGGYDQMIASLSGGGGTVALGANKLDVNQASGAINFGGALTGSGVFQKSGAGALTFGTAGNTAVIALSSGALIDVQGGVLAGSAFGRADWSGNFAGLNIAAGATFNGVEGAIRVDALTGAGTLYGGYYGSGSVTIGVANGSGTFSGLIADNPNPAGSKLNLVKTGTGTQTLSGSSAYTGTTTIDGGVLQAGFGRNHVFSQASKTTINAGGVLDMNGTSQAIDQVVINGGRLQYGDLTGAVTSYGGQIASLGGAMSLTIASGDTGSFGGNSYTGPTTINGGTLWAWASDAFSHGSATTINSGGALDLGSQAQTIATVDLAGGWLRNGSLAGAITSTGGAITNLSGSASLNATGGTTLLSGVNGYTGATTLNGGGLTAIAANAFSSASATTINSGVLDLGGFGQQIDSVTMTGGTIRNGSLAGAISAGGGNIAGLGGSASLDVTSGAVFLFGTNSYSGATTVHGELVGAGANTFSNASTTTVDAGGVLNLGGAAQQIAAVDLAGGQIRNGSLTGVIASTGGTVSDLAGPASLMVGAGVTNLTGVNTYTGATTVNGGALQGLADNAFARASVTTVNGGTLYFGHRAQAIDVVNLAGGLILDGALTGAVNSTGGSINGLTGSASLSATAGETYLFGNNAYTGATSITGGVLVGAGANVFSTASALTIGAAGALDLGGSSQQVGSIAGSGRVSNRGAGDAALTIGVDNSTSAFGGVIQDGAFRTGLNKAGSGVLTLTGVNTYTGATNVSAGALVVNGSIGASALTTVAAGSVLTGVGATGAAQVNGALAPGAGTAGTSLNVAGPLTFGATGSLVTTVNATTASFVNVTGVAALAGNVVASITAGPIPARSYTILKSAGLNGTTFAGLAATGLPMNFTPSLSYTATDVLLSFTSSLGGFGAQMPQNPTGVSTAINAYFDNHGVLPQNFVRLYGLSGQGLQGALNSLTGEGATGAQQPLFYATNAFMSAMLGHEDAFGAGGGAGAPGSLVMAYAPLPPPPGSWYALALHDTPKAAPQPRWSVWATGFGGNGRISGDPVVIGSSNATSSVLGVSSGFDYRVSPDTRLGVAFAGGGLNWNLSQVSGSGRSDFFQAGVYGRTHFGAAYVAGAMAFANYWTTTNRMAAFGDLLQGRYSAQGVAGRVEGGYRFASPLGGLTPYGGLQVQRFNTPAYSENDLSLGGFGLSYAARGASATRSELGMRYDLVVPVADAQLTLRARAAWAHDWTSAATVSAMFQSLPGAYFVTTGARPVSDLALISAGADLRLGLGLSVFGKFDGELASRAQTYAGSMGVRYRW